MPKCPRPLESPKPKLSDLLILPEIPDPPDLPKLPDFPAFPELLTFYETFLANCSKRKTKVALINQISEVNFNTVIN